MILSEKQEHIILAALTDLDERLGRGLANSGLGQTAAKLLHDGSHMIHESDITELRKRFGSGR